MLIAEYDIVAVMYNICKYETTVVGIYTKSIKISYFNCLPVFNRLCDW